MLKIGIIGTGKHGSRYANHVVNDIDSMELVAISRRSEERLAQAELWQTQSFEDWHDLVHDSRVDAVISVVPPALNLTIAKECSVAGKPLLMEKPLAIDRAEATEIVDLMKRNNCKLTVAQTLRYNPVIEMLKQELPSMGRIHSIHANQRIEPSSLGWHDIPDIAGAGVLIHTAVHVFDALHYITGKKITRVFASSYTHHNRVLEDLVTLLFEMEGDIAGSIDVSKVGQGRSGRFEFICSEGQLQGEQIYGRLQKIRNATIKAHHEVAPKPTIIPLLEDWGQYLRGEGENPITGDDGRYALSVCSSCLLSAKKQEWVDVSG